MMELTPHLCEHLENTSAFFQVERERERERESITLNIAHIVINLTLVCLIGFLHLSL